MTVKHTLQERERELRSLFATPAGREELQELASRYQAASGKRHSRSPSRRHRRTPSSSLPKFIRLGFSTAPNANLAPTAGNTSRTSASSTLDDPSQLVYSANRFRGLFY